MADIFGIIGNVVDALANYGTAKAANQWSAQREAVAREQNYAYGEAAANAADIRTRSLYNDLYSPSAQLSQIKEAGLSPSLFYGDGGGISGQTGAMGTGAAGIMGQTFGVSPMNMSQIGLQQAQADLLKAQTRKTNEETKTEAGENERGAAEIEQIITKTKNTNLKNVFQEYQNALSEIALGVSATTEEFQVKNYIKQTEYLEHLVTSAKVKADIDEKSEEDVLAYIKERTNNLIADSWLKQSQSKLTKQQVLDLVNQITNRDKQLEINENTLKEQVKQWGVQNKLKDEEIDAMWAGVVVNGVVGGAGNILNLLKFAKGLRGGKIMGLQ